MKKFAIHPGYVSKWAKPDCMHMQRNYVGFSNLIDLYGINPRDCILWDDEKRETFVGRKHEDYNHLYPSPSGNYEIK